jgi:hypothetical protein
MRGVLLARDGPVPPVSKDVVTIRSLRELLVMV